MDEIGKKQLSVLSFRGGQICPFMHVALWLGSSVHYPKFLDAQKTQKLASKSKDHD